MQEQFTTELRLDSVDTPGGHVAVCCTLCCSVLQCVAVCCSVLQCVYVYAFHLNVYTQERFTTESRLNFVDTPGFKLPLSPEEASLENIS